MPILWRYLLSHYLKVFFLCVVAFVAILLTMRLDEIAYFATLGSNTPQVLWFALQQIPYIIPIAIPISALISSILLVQNLSHAHEMTSMRACGFSLRDIYTPVLIAALFLSMLNFYIVSELSTSSHLNAGQLKNQLRSINPLFLLHNKHLMRMKGFYFDAYGPSRVGEYARDVIFFSPGKHGNRLNMMTAKLIKATPLTFVGEQVTLLAGRKPKKDQNDKNSESAILAGNENLILENMQESKATIHDFSQMLEKKIWTVNNDHLRLPELLVRLRESRDALVQSRQDTDKIKIKEARNTLNEGLTEIMRRFSVALAVFSFTFMGLAFGTTISRNRSNKGIFFVVALGAFFLIAFFAAKSFGHALVPSAMLYLMPHAIICAAAFAAVRRIAHGIE